MTLRARVNIICQLLFCKLRKAERKVLVLSWKLAKYNKKNMSNSVKPKLKNTIIKGNNQTIFRDKAKKKSIGRKKKENLRHKK